MATRSLWRSRAKLAVVATTLCTGAAAAAVATSDDPASAAKLCTTVPVRLLRDATTAASVVFDYQYSLWGLPEGSKERAKIKHEVHLRSARKLQELCFINGGIYIKLGQHIGQLEYLVPQEYVITMRESMLNKCPVSSYDQVCEVFKKELGETPDKVFDEFDREPIASASLAQVHVARTHDGQKVAVKVQHTHMTDTAAADQATVEFLINTLHWLFPSFDYRWLVAEIRESLPKASYFDNLLFDELDFLIEAKNSVKCLENFRKMSPHIADYVYAPEVVWSLTTSKLLTMEFMDGVQVNDVNSIRRLGMQPGEVSKLVSQTFAEMMFKHGFVHCDPHAANLLVRPLPYGKRSIFVTYSNTTVRLVMFLLLYTGKKKPQLILLDHGLYKELDFSTRFSYASLWRALVFSDANGIKEHSVKLGAGEDLYVLFAGIVTMRPWNRVIDPAMDHLVIKDTDSSELQMYASQYFPQISELLRRLPRVILLMLKTNDCLRAVNNSLLSVAAASQLQGSSMETFLIIGKVSSEAVVEAKMMQTKSLFSRINIWLEEFLFEARLLALQIALWLLQVRKALT
ncbi:putative ABC1 protein [Hibiscus syriacus]|uniref:ABC1 protein n=1 Tax=Hibiscus syriacus TaxID=106335 RepID=A0A6A2ZC96_HIBSY|nr:putative ABC1 protein [Hibiscus syriacus]